MLEEAKQKEEEKEKEKQKLREEIRTCKDFEEKLSYI